MASCHANTGEGLEPALYDGVTGLTVTAILIVLEHGAHWAIGALSFLLMFSIRYEIPEVITGLVGVVFIVASFVWSIRHNRAHAGSAPQVSVD